MYSAELKKIVEVFELESSFAGIESGGAFCSA